MEDYSKGTRAQGRRRSARYLRLAGTEQHCASPTKALTGPSHRIDSMKRHRINDAAIGLDHFVDRSRCRGAERIAQIGVEQAGIIEGGTNTLERVGPVQVIGKRWDIMKTAGAGITVAYRVTVGIGA